MQNPQGRLSQDFADSWELPFIHRWTGTEDPSFADCDSQQLNLEHDLPSATHNVHFYLSKLGTSIMYISPNSVISDANYVIAVISCKNDLRVVAIFKAILILNGFCPFVHRSRSPQACTNYIHNQMRSGPPS